MAAVPASPQQVRPKQVLIDEWSTREKLALASSVSKSGDQNWHSTSRVLRTFAEPNRPADWFSQKNCALQYEDMLDKVDLPKRKRGERGEETAQDVIVRELTQKRMAEIREEIVKRSANLCDLRQQKEQIEAEHPPPELLQKVWQRKLDAEKEADVAAVRHQEWARQRELAIAQAKLDMRRGLLRTRRTQQPQTPAPPVVVIKTEDLPPVPAAGLLNPAAPDGKDESNVQSGGETAAPTTPMSQTPPLTSPLLTSLLRSPTGQSPTGKETGKEPVGTPVKQAVPSSPAFSNSALAVARQLGAQIRGSVTPAATPVKGPVAPLVATSSTNEDASQPPASSPTLSKLLELPLSSASAGKLPPLPSPGKDDETEEAKDGDESDEMIGETSDSQTGDVDRTTHSGSKLEAGDETRADSDIQMEMKIEENQETKTPLTRRQRELRNRPAATPTAVPVTPIKIEMTTAPEAVTSAVGAATPANTVPSNSASITTRRSGRIRGHREVSESDSLPEKKPSVSDEQLLIDVSASEESLDSAPVRVAPASKAPSVSDSFPNSPATTIHSEDTDMERERKRWQKAIQPLLRSVMTHQYSHVFMTPAYKEVGDEYNETVKRPVDLTSIKKRVDNQSLENAIRNTAEFECEMMLLFQNAIMYNKKGHDVHEMTVELQKEFCDLMEEFIASEKQAAASGQQSTSGKTSSLTSETPSVPKQRVRDRRTPATASVQAQEDAAARRRSRTSTDTDPGSSTPSASVPQTRTALRKKINA